MIEFFHPALLAQHLNTFAECHRVDVIVTHALLFVRRTMSREAEGWHFPEAYPFFASPNFASPTVFVSGPAISLATAHRIAHAFAER